MTRRGPVRGRERHQCEVERRRQGVPAAAVAVEAPARRIPGLGSGPPSESSRASPACRSSGSASYRTGSPGATPVCKMEDQSVRDSRARCLVTLTRRHCWAHSDSSSLAFQRYRASHSAGSGGTGSGSQRGDGVRREALRGPANGRNGTNLTLAAVLAPPTSRARPRATFRDVRLLLLLLELLLLRRHRGSKVLLAHAVTIVVLHVAVAAVSPALK